MVKNLDIELQFAGNGEEAVDLFQSSNPDLIFMDISMPKVDGKEKTRGYAPEADLAHMLKLSPDGSRDEWGQRRNPCGRVGSIFDKTTAQRDGAIKTAPFAYWARSC